MNSIYKKYAERCSFGDKYFTEGWPRKVKGSLSANLFKEEAEKVLKKYNLPPLEVEKLLDEPELTEAVNKLKEAQLEKEKNA